MVLLFRYKKEGRLSIEKVFQPIKIKKLQLPEDLKGIKSAVRIIIFLLKIRDNVVHITGDIHYAAIVLFRKKIILTIHDLNHFEDLTGLRKRVYGFIWFWLPMKIARRITVISPYTKLQLLKHFRVDENKIIVVNNSFIPISKISLQKNEKIFKILVIGIKKNKNIENLIIAIKDIKNIKLSVIGLLANSQKELLKKNRINYESNHNITEQELALYYNSSNMLYFASTKEGFGLPILEAQSIGLPVITSNTTAMPYVAGKGALIVDPYNVDAIKSAVIKLMNSTMIREQIVSYGYLNVKKYTQQEFIKYYQIIYSEIISSTLFNGRYQE